MNLLYSSKGILLEKVNENYNLIVAFHTHIISLSLSLREVMSLEYKIKECLAKTNSELNMINAKNKKLEDEITEINERIEMFETLMNAKEKLRLSKMKNDELAGILAEKKYIEKQYMKDLK